MVNTEDFIKRLEVILDYYSLNASAFADKIGVQRSSLSHLLSGRNKPSLDFILKILDVFPEVDLYWVLNGKGTFPKSESKNNPIIATPPFKNQNNETDVDETPELALGDLTSKKNLLEEKLASTYLNTPNTAFHNKTSEIDRIVIFYKNGTFNTYSPD